MTSPITSLNANFGCNTTKFGNAGGAAQQQLLYQQQTQQIQEARKQLQEKRAGVDASWHALAVGAFFTGITTIGYLGKNIAEYVTGNANETLGTIIKSSLPAVGGITSNVIAPLSLLYGLYYYVNGKNKA